MDQSRLAHLQSVVKADIASGLYHGLVLKVARGGKVALDVAIGSADAEQSKPLQSDSVFNLFSITKSFTNLLTLRAIELGQFALTTRISDLIPEFSGHGRENIQMWHLLSHQAGFPITFEVKPGMYIDNFDEMVAAVIEVIRPVELPCATVAYSPLIHHVLMGEALRRTDPQRRSYRQQVQDEILTPLKMKDTAVGLRKDLKPRKVVPDFRGNYPIGHRGHSNYGPNGAFEEEHAEMPWVGIVSSVPDMFRYTEMLRLDGALDGARILSPATLALARRNFTGDKPNELHAQRGRERGWDPSPAYIGLGFFLRGTVLSHHMFGTLASPGTFGNYGAGTTIFWVDPERDLSFVALSAGLMESNANTERFQRLADIVISAVD
ncbi:MAG TPA: serine hydrolase domain-containing protein [Steroidobacteraceae bacterium]|jgi:CubicO group peptidase (beta-lactamase class C family)|nr:serine hydrolase domain-containing protein [Steroidobacteraceae bacterium]